MEEMYKKVGWMKPTDQEILRFLEPTDYLLSPVVIARNIGFDNSYVGKRCRELHQRGLLTRDDNGTPLYNLTELGELVATRQLDPKEIEERTKLEDD